MKSIKVLLLCILVAGVYTTSVAFGKEKIDEIKGLIEKIQEQDVQISSFKMYILKSTYDAFSEKEAMEQLESIKRNEPGYKWNIEYEDNGSFVAEGFTKVASTDIDVKVKVTGNKIGGKYKMYYAYEVNSKWNIRSLDYVMSHYKNQINEYEVFFTFKGSIEQDERIGLYQQAIKLLDGLHGAYIEGVKEKQFISMSAYSKDLDLNSITADGQKINLQLGLRQDMKSERMDVTIGTPVITSGY